MFLENKLFYKDFDPGAAYAYGRIGDPGGLPARGRYGVQTAGASTTITATNGTPFAPLERFVGSILVFHAPPPDTKLVRRLVTWTSPTQIVVDSNITLPAGTNWFWYPFKQGTAVTDGWHHVGDLAEISVYFDVTTLGSTTIEANIELGGGPFSAPVQATTNPAAVSATVSLSIAAVGRKVVEVLSVAQSLRVGLRVTGGPATDAVTVWVKGRQRQAK